jgi:hypothetical protein
LGFKLREIEAESKFCRELTMEAIAQAVPLAEVQAVLAETSVCEQRVRKLNMLVTVLLTIAMNIYTRSSIGEVMSKIAQGLRYIWPDPEYRVANDSAISQRRYQLGARPLVALFHRVCRPLATPETSGAFLFGLRLMAIDGSSEDVPDTPENAAVFGRYHGDRGDSAFPQIKTVYLAECGTHAIVDAGLWPCHTSERLGGFRMLRSVGPGMLVMWDTGFHNFDMVQAAVDRGAQVLARLPAHVRPHLVRRLKDGSYLATIRPSAYARRKRGECLLVRIIEYTITDPNLPHAGEIHRLLTTLLDPQRYPALELACAYHERWEIELVIDETDTHQRLADRPLRSLKPVGVIQELYALLIAHYAIRCLMHEAALQMQIDPDRLSFTHALNVLQEAIPEFQMTAADLLPKLYSRLLNDLAAKPLPERRLRTNPRVVKRKMSNFRLKRPEHYNWPQPFARSFREAVALI